MKQDNEIPVFLEGGTWEDLTSLVKEEYDAGVCPIRICFEEGELVSMIVLNDPFDLGEGKRIGAGRALSLCLEDEGLPVYMFTPESIDDLAKARRAVLVYYPTQDSVNNNL